MKRRKFFVLASSCAAGLALASSCKGSKSESEFTENSETSNLSLGKEPSYRKTIKTSFSSGTPKSASDSIVVALIGAGLWGSILIKQASETGENILVKYICDVDDTKGGHAISELEKKQGFKPIRVRDMRKVFDDKEVDAVFIATPEHWHALATIWACQAGKDVYVEKCISHNITEGQKMIEATMKYERVVQCGTFNRSTPEALTARDYIKSGELGDLVAVHVKSMLPGPIPFTKKDETVAPNTIDWDLWLGPAPKAPYSVSRNKSWHYYWDYGSGNAMGNEAIHQLDLARLVLDNPGLPSSVYCTGGRYFFNDDRDVPDYQLAYFDCDNYVMTLQAGDCVSYLGKSGPEIRYGNEFPNWSHNGTHVEIIGTKRMMYVGRMGGGWQVFDKGGEVVAGQTSYYPLKAHLLNFLDCVRTRKQPNSNIVEGHNSSILIHLANLSYRTGSKQLRFSPQSETILNDSKAQEMISCHYRKGFEIPTEV
ncbi:Gfo/Idh/MocA family protein [Sunxiuqinia rutila]|uniref:Gfo/Idh/MocA family protein n=1 Tax=Sunxiuqinia rutila TaxID=1397841 RepID=UPI003D35B9A2